MKVYQVKNIMLENEIKDVEHLLHLNQLEYESSITHTIGLYDKDQLVATGSLDDHVIKMIAVHPDYQSLNLSGKVLSHLLLELDAKKINHFFLYTKPENKNVFANFNFHEIISREKIILYENREQNITDVLTKIAASIPQKKGTRGCIVMNLNPLTNGHLYLINEALKKVDDLIIFLVESDHSVIPYKSRLKLINRATKHLKNVYVLPSTPYIISKATFPTYFLKEKEQMDVFTDLDIAIYQQYIEPIFNIDYRFVGNEPFDVVTNTYNEAMKKLLKDRAHIIPRLEYDGQIISASHVRKLAEEKQYSQLKEVVPKVTYRFLVSSKGRSLFHEK
ncbi:MAG: adenylyltransferase/cytidyltransferase family protein [Acholeplasmataceae bacterium]|nr:adenylyltransferase/cytidyltransferase family protein [Acholeplasmataceae bacterium]